MTTSDKQKPRIVIVEDNAIEALDLKSVIDSLGYEVTDVVDSGQKAIESVKASPPDLLLMDILLKGELDGIETAELIQSESDIPLIYITAITGKDFFQRAKHTNPYSYLFKPYTSEVLIATLDIALNRVRLDKELKSSHEELETANRKMAIEITKKLQIQEALEASERKYRSLAENVPDGIFVLDARGHYYYANDSLARFFKCPP